MDLMPPRAPRYLSGAGWLMLAVALPLLWDVAQPFWRLPADPRHYLFWHTAMELASVAVALLVFATGYHALFSARKGAVVLLGIAFLGVALLDFLHAMSYAGMPDAFSRNTAHKAMYFWLAARTLAALALLVYAALPALPEPARRHKWMGLGALLALVALLAMHGLLAPQDLPVLYVEGAGLSSLKIGWERALAGLNVATLAVLFRRRHQLGAEHITALALAVALSAASALFFTGQGIIDKDRANLVGHVYKLAAYVYLFQATFQEAIRRPLQLLATQYRREEITLNAAPDAILWVDGGGKILMANPAATVLTGYAEAELVGRDIAMLMPAHARARHAEAIRVYFRAPVSRPMGQVDLELQRRDGVLVPVDISLGNWADEDGARHAIAYIRDLSERKAFEESLRHQATHDELTGLPNRWLLRLQLEQALARAARHQTRVAVLFLDLDHFKTINDSFGHAAGDQLLQQVGQRIGRELRENDVLARLGGDEFAILLADLDQVDEAIRVGSKLLAALHDPYRLDQQTVYVGGSLGLAFYPDDGADSETLLRFADLAMYQAKQNGRGVAACYSPDMDRRVHDDMQLHTRLKGALVAGALRLHYQPLVAVGSGAIVGAEALLRWYDPVLGEVPPSRFIPVAEASGLILPLSEWVLATACEQIAEWERAGLGLPVAVNISAQQFGRPDLVGIVRAALQRAGARAALLDIEITESAAMVQPELAREHIQALAGLGCSVALDDFGTGYSSLAYLKALPVSKLKIDRSFIRDLADGDSDATIVLAIIGLARSMGLALVAEGVETAGQLRFLRAHGCEVYQGWLFARAMPAADLTDLLRGARRQPADHASDGHG